MTTLFNRGGTERQPNGGERIHQYIAMCGRCGGAGGSEAWRHTGTVCYDCGGSGKGPLRAEKLYTAEELEVLNARLAVRQQRRAAQAKAKLDALETERAAQREQFAVAHAEVLALLEELVADEKARDPDQLFWGEFRSDALRRVQMTERMEVVVREGHQRMQQYRATISRRKAAGHAGLAGARVKTRARVIRSQHISTDRSYYPPRHRYLVQLETEAGHLLTWWAGHGMEVSDEFTECAFTVKEWSEFKGVPQTVVQRVALKQLEAA